jgi:hypothetical protein
MEYRNSLLIFIHNHRVLAYIRCYIIYSGDFFLITEELIGPKCSIFLATLAISGLINKLLASYVTGWLITLFQYLYYILGYLNRPPVTLKGVSYSH